MDDANSLGQATAQSESPGAQSRRIRTQRLEAFSDGVFAIAVTLLVLDLAVPKESVRDPLDAIAAQWPSYLTYVVSFATIGLLWLGHTAITEYLEHADAVLLRLNLLLLLLVSFLPFPTKLLGLYIASDQSERVAVSAYGFTLLTSTAVLSLLWRYAVHAQLVRPSAQDGDLQALTRNLTPGLAGYAVLIGLGLAFPLVAIFGYLLLAVALMTPLGMVRARRRHPQG